MSWRNCGTGDLTTHGFRASFPASVFWRLSAALRCQRGGNDRLVRVHVGDGRDADARRLDDARPLDYQPRGWLSDGAPSAAPRKAVRNRRFLKSGRPGSNRRRPAWEAFLALVGQGFFGGGSRNRITQYTLQSLQIGDFPRGGVPVAWLSCGPRSRSKVSTWGSSGLLQATKGMVPCSTSAPQCHLVGYAALLEDGWPAAKWSTSRPSKTRPHAG